MLDGELSSNHFTMSKSIFFIFFLLLFCSAYGQGYILTYVQETNFLGNTIHEIFESNNTARFKFDRRTSKEVVYASETYMDLGIDDKIPPPFIYTDYLEGEVTSQYVYGSNYELVSDEIPRLEWTAIAESKEILNMQCAAAKVTFRGRTYVVYYTSDLGITGGVYKFTGLPGYVLAAYSTDGLVSFETTQIKKLAKIDIKPPEFSKAVIAYPAFVDIYTKWQDKITRMLKAEEDEETTYEISFNTIELY